MIGTGLKPLPYSKETENSLIGCFLIDNNIIDEYFSKYGIELFYDNQNIKIIERIFELYSSGQATDFITVAEGVDGITPVDLVLYTEIIPTTAYRQSYAEILLKDYKRRELILAGNKLINSAYDENIDLNNISELTMNKINSTMLEGVTKTTSFEDDLSLIEKHIAECSKSGLMGYSWGIDMLDKYTGGIRKGKTYRIGSPSGVGKTNLLYHIIPHLLNQGVKILFVSLENSIETTYIKTMAAKQAVNANDLERGVIPLEVSYLKANKDKFILTDKLFDFNEIKREILRVKPDVVLLDYIGLVDMKCNERDKYDKYADEVKTFVQLNQWLAWIDLSNLNKDDDEEKIRLYKGFNGSAKLRNNTDFAMHMFYYKDYFDYKVAFIRDAEEGQGEKIKMTNAITFFITKNRMGRDLVEDVFLIDYSKGYNYIPATREQKEKWKAFND